MPRRFTVEDVLLLALLCFAVVAVLAGIGWASGVLDAKRKYENAVKTLADRAQALADSQYSQRNPVYGVRREGDQRKDRT